MSSVITDSCSLRVSSVLNKNAKEFGKQYMIDTCDDTCWNSDQGSPQWLRVSFPKCETIEEVHIQFQGGFAGKDCWIEGNINEEMSRICSFYPEDSNALQVFRLPNTVTNSIKIVFNSSTDFFGRVIIYKLDVKGKS